MYIDPADGPLLLKIVTIGVPVVCCAGSVVIGGMIFFLARRDDKKFIEPMNDTSHEE